MIRLKMWNFGFRFIGFSALTLCLLTTILAGRASALMVTGNLFEVLDPTGARIGTTIDRWYITVGPGGLSYDVLSWEVNFSGNPVDVNGDGEIAFFDARIKLYVDDGSLDDGDLKVEDDLSGSTFGDGSVSFEDPASQLTDAVIPPGTYLFAIGADYFPFGAAEVIAGLNTNGTVDPRTTIDGTNFTPINHGDYQITFSNNVTITGNPGTADNIKPVPEPSTMLLIGSGLLGLAGLRRKFSK